MKRYRLKFDLDWIGICYPKGDILKFDNGVYHNHQANHTIPSGIVENNPYIFDEIVKEEYRVTASCGTLSPTVFYRIEPELHADEVQEKLNHSMTQKEAKELLSEYDMHKYNNGNSSTSIHDYLKYKFGESDD